jgi:hypothetical protein
MKKNLSRVVPEEQCFKPGRKAYWYLLKKTIAVWRFDEKSPKDTLLKKKGNYFYSERECLSFFGLPLPQKRGPKRLTGKKKVFTV